MFGDDFYPTPSTLVNRMLDKVDQTTVSTILEPSAGRGDMVEHILSAWHSHWNKPTIDTIEIEPELRAVLKDKGHAPIASDFLAFQSFKSYDLIMMNPPFSNGAAHLLKALSLIERGGQVVCLLNAETIRKPYTNERRELLEKLEQLGASIEFISDGFTDAVRKTSVETALVHVSIKAAPASDILGRLVEAQRLEDEERGPVNDVVEGDYIRGAVRRYELEAEAGLSLIREYQALKPILTRGFGDDFHKSSPILELKVDGRDDSLSNDFIERIRGKYWGEMFQSDQFAQLFTQSTREQYREKIDDLKRYEFDIANIKQMQIDISGAMLEGLDESIVRLFDEFSSQYWDEQSKNIHYYNGWRTNKAHRINKKIITRRSAYSAWGDFHAYNIDEFIADIEKVFAYLDGALTPSIEQVRNRLKRAENDRETKGVDFTYCSADFFKKGTTHITFTREDLLKKFNLIGSQRKGWLPPNYGRASYADMTREERDVVEAFEGREAYQETCERQEFYLGRPELVLGSGDAA